MKGALSVLLIVLFFNTKSQNIDFSVFPNPFAQTLNCSFNIFSSSQVSINILDITGSNVAVVLQDTTLDTGHYEYSTVLNYLDIGVYFTKLNISDSTYFLKAIKTETATFICPLMSYLRGDSLFLPIKVNNSHGDSVKYTLYDRWGNAVIMLDTFLIAGDYSLCIPLNDIPDNVYVQLFRQDTSTCSNTVIISRTLLGIRENSIYEKIRVMQLGSNEVAIRAEADYEIAVINALGQKILNTQCNHRFFLSSGLYFFVVTVKKNKAVALKHIQK